MNDGGAATWREVIEKHHSSLVDELSGRLDSELRDAVTRAVAAESSAAGEKLRRACDDARTAQVESLNQVLRRMRSSAEDKAMDLLAEGCASFASRLVVLVFESNQAHSIAGLHVESFDMEAAPAILSAIESLDPVVAMATAAEISTGLAAALGGAESAQEAKAYLFPVVARHSVMAMLVASGVDLSAPIELLCEAAGMRLEASLQQEAPPEIEQEIHQEAHHLESHEGEAGDFVQLAAVVPASETAAPRSWNDLTPEDQKLHLQAQRMARVRVAEMRLYHEPELRRGVDACDIYGSLRDHIDPARDQFLQTFLSKSRTMVDYLHLEILRSLAHGDDRILGYTYPGPMV